MMKKLLVMICAIALVFSCAFGVSAKAKDPIISPTGSDIEDFDPDVEVEGPELVTPEKEVIEIVITPEDWENATKKQVDMRIWLEVIRRAISEIPKQTNDAVMKKTKEIKSEFGAYVDLILSKQIGEDDPEIIKETKKDLTIKIGIPTDIINTDKSVVRTYKLIRYYDGKVEVIPTVFADNALMVKSLTFDTNKFSTCAIVYTDTKRESDSPKTGDSSAVLGAMMVITLAAGSLLVIKKSAKA
ncbi:MAG: LPXTG cell wall anchor domain-containing protein [Clostridiales bacterium]|nr:LPXTG cell wall anchor domain-containing protein [Candidatus Equinaster intestinalis]